MIRRTTIFLFFAGVFFFFNGVFHEVRAEFSGATSTKEAACAIKLDWTYINGNNGQQFRIQRTTSTNWGGGSIIDFGNILSYIAGQDNYTHTDVNNLKAGWTYKYRIDTSGSGWEYFNPTGGIPITSIASPSVPNNFVATGTYRNERIDLSWSPVTTLSTQGGYDIFRATSVDGATFSPDVMIADLSSSTDAYNDLGNGALNPALVYRYTIKSFEGGSNAGCVEKVYSTPITVVVPSLSTGVQATYLFTDSKVDINWTRGFGSSVSGIEVWRVHEEGGDNIKLNGTPSCSGNACLFSDSYNLISNHHYKYHVRSCNSVSGFLGCSDFSDLSNKVTITDAPQGFEARVLYTSSSVDEGKIFMKWENAFNDSDYIIERTDSHGVTILESAVHSSDDFITKVVTAPLNERYTYTIKGNFGEDDFGNDILSLPSLPQNIDFNIGKILRGQAWGAGSSSLSGVSDKVGIGWVNFNADDDLNATVNYSVQVGREDGLFSGVARGSVSGIPGNGYGWLSFNQNDLIGCPDDPTGTTISRKCSAKLININGEDQVRGWARFLFDKEYTDTEAWDGWVSLNRIGVEGTEHLADKWTPKETRSLVNNFPFFSQNNLISFIGNTFNDIFKPFQFLTALADVPTTVDYGITFARIFGEKTGTFSGKAWAGNVGGWINFDLRNGNPEFVAADIVNRKPIVSNVRFEIDPKSNWYKEPQRRGSDSVWCLEDPYYVVKFDYNDPDNDSITGARIQFVRDDNGIVDAEFNGTTTTLELAISGEVASGTSRFEFVNPLGGATTASGGYIYYGPETTLKKSLNTNTSYKVLVSAEDGYDFSDPVPSSNTTTTPRYYSPLVDFTWNPVPAAIQTQVNMRGSLLHRFGPTVQSPSGWQWVFPHASPGTAEGSIATVMFSATSRPDDLVKLSITQPGFMQSTTTICALEKEDVVNATSTTTINLRRRVFRER